MTPPSDRRWLWWLPFLTASAVFAGWASFTSQQLLGQLMRWDVPWLMPAILDNLMVGTVVAYIAMPSRFTRAVSGLVLLASAVANAQAHLYDPNSADLGVPLWVAITWSVLPPVAMFVIAHFIVEARKDRTNGMVAPTPTPSDAGVPVRVLRGHDRADADAAGTVATGGDPTSPPRRKTPTRTKATRRTGTPSRRGRRNGPDRPTLAEWVIRDGLTKPEQVKAAYHVGTGKAVDALALARNGHGG